MKKALLTILIGVVILGGVLWAWNRYGGLVSTVQPPAGDIAGDIERNNTPLELPEGFSIEVFAKEVPGARVLVGPDRLGNFWLSQTSEGVVSNVAVDKEGKVTNITPIFKGLDRPHGLALDPQDPLTLYIAETDSISRVQLYTEGSLQQVAQLPGGGRHFTRTIGFGPDGRLYVSIGSSCDVCEEENPRRAAIYFMEPDGSDLLEYADGLRNAVFFDWDPVTGDMWATEMGRDHLGDNLPPDEVNIVQRGNWYGWPWLYGDNVRDSEFKPGVTPDAGREPVPSHIDLQAHSAPLGLAFVPEEGWPADMALDLLVAYHGSWNRTEPTGYKIMHFDLTQDTREAVDRQDFISGWLQEDGGILGRPVGLLARPGGVLYITDDHAGVIYKITYQQ